MRANFLLILLSWLFVTSFALPSPSSKTSLIEKRTPGWQFYYDVTASTHQTNFLKWSGLGYRMISLTVYGQPPNNKYAAVWVLRTGPSWSATHQASASSYQAFFDSHSPNGYVTTMVTATGPANAPVFAGVMEQNGVTDWYQKCNIAGSQAFKTEINNGNNDRYYLKSFTEYGSSNNRLYSGVWYHNDQFDKYSAFLDQSFSEFPPAMIAETSKPIEVEALHVCRFGG